MCPEVTRSVQERTSRIRGRVAQLVQYLLFCGEITSTCRAEWQRESLSAFVILTKSTRWPLAYHVTKTAEVL